jgi:hypothetical protein
MIEKVTLPSELIDLIGGEQQEFAIKAKYSALRKNAKMIFIFGSFWTFATSFTAYSMLGDFLAGKTVHYRVNGVSPSRPSLKTSTPFLVIRLVPRGVERMVA